MKYSWIAITTLGFCMILSAGGGRKGEAPNARNVYLDDVENRVAKIEVTLPALKSKRDSSVDDPARRKYLSTRVDDLEDRIEEIRVDVRESRADASEPTHEKKQKIHTKLAELESLYQTKAD